MKSRTRRRGDVSPAEYRRRLGPVLAMAVALFALQFAALSGFDPSAARAARASGSITPEGGETALARQVLRATLAADAHALGERADGKTLSGGPLPFILPDLPSLGLPRLVDSDRCAGTISLAGAPCASHYRVRAPPAAKA